MYGFRRKHLGFPYFGAVAQVRHCDYPGHSVGLGLRLPPALVVNLASPAGRPLSFSLTQEPRFSSAGTIPSLRKSFVRQASVSSICWASSNGKNG
ncbi:hypothetical protein O181_082412 [Austropuccinia psidii MF-1]|uniref:Uncharacterized protein n=1 Tax=Austropuccinia psidii MF-1 TaxID=1389203 RepID=A0A9Q3IJ73_9BASI|nr:hypothetical protein [Austropuccinia psidii MF-1]